MSLLWKIASVLVRGSAHEASETPCQDASAVRTIGRYVVAAVADGLSSAARAAEGATLVVEAALQRVEELYSQASSSPLEVSETARDALRKAREAVLAKAETLGCPPRELASTLLVVLASEGEVGYAQAGDGAIVAGYDDESLLLLPRPEPGEYVNELVPLTSSHAIEASTSGSVPGVPRFVILLTDGLEPLCMVPPGPQPFPRFFWPLAHGVGESDDRVEVEQELRSLLGSDRFRERSGDDMTLVVLFRSRTVPATQGGEEGA